MCSGKSSNLSPKCYKFEITPKEIVKCEDLPTLIGKLPKCLLSLRYDFRNGFLTLSTFT